MDSLESKIVEILKRGTPIRAVKITEILGVERREVNRHLQKLNMRYPEPL